MMPPQLSQPYLRALLVLSFIAMFSFGMSIVMGVTAGIQWLIWQNAGTAFDARHPIYQWVRYACVVVGSPMLLYLLLPEMIPYWKSERPWLISVFVALAVTIGFTRPPASWIGLLQAVFVGVLVYIAGRQGITNGMHRAPRSLLDLSSDD